MSGVGMQSDGTLGWRPQHHFSPVPQPLGVGLGPWNVVQEALSLAPPPSVSGCTCPRIGGGEGNRSREGEGKKGGVRSRCHWRHRMAMAEGRGRGLVLIPGTGTGRKELEAFVIRPS